MKFKLFYSYSHKNQRYREEIEKALARLKSQGVLDVWFDYCITPGTSISKSIEKQIENSNIFLFLFSRDFLASKPCTDEWKIVTNISRNRTIYRVPIILEECDWKDFLGKDDIKALPVDGKPIEKYVHSSQAYQEILNGLKQVIEECSKNFEPKTEFMEECKKIDLISLENVSIDKLFVFPVITSKSEEEIYDSKIEDKDAITSSKFALIYGEEASGKTTLCKHLFTSIIDENKPSILIDLNQIHEKKPNENIFREIYERQFNGNYELWKKQDQCITFIFDNLTNYKKSLSHVLYTRDIFKEANIVVSINSDEYISYFRNDKRLANFKIFKIDKLSNVKLEELIKKRFLLDNDEPDYKQIDIIEKKVLDVVQKNLVPRYPIVVLSIMQTLEAFMPSEINISSYGHCYKVLITAHLIKLGIAQSDSTLNSCFNFLEEYAFYKFKNHDCDYKEFKNYYQEKFLINDSIINRLEKDSNKPILDLAGKFTHKYEYYYFLGAYLAKNKETEVIKKLTETNYLNQNNIILMFVLHHTTDKDIIENIILQSMCTLDKIGEASLKAGDTKMISDIIEKMPKNIISDRSIEEERKKSRNIQDQTERDKQNNDDNYDGSIQVINDIFKLLKNNELFGQILRNHSGNLNRNTIKEILGEAVSSGLRLVKLMLNEDTLRDSATSLHARYPDKKIDQFNRLFKFFCFFWTISNIKRIVNAISVKELIPLIEDIFENKDYPVYDLILYFTRLDTLEKFTVKEKNQLFDLLKIHEKNAFVYNLLSLRTQIYINTHVVKHDIIDSICAELKIKNTSKNLLSRKK